MLPVVYSLRRLVLFFYWVSHSASSLATNLYHALSCSDTVSLSRGCAVIIDGKGRPCVISLKFVQWFLSHGYVSYYTLSSTYILTPSRDIVLYKFSLKIFCDFFLHLNWWYFLIPYIPCVPFLDAFSHLYKRLCPSVGLSVGLSVCLSETLS